MSKPNIQILVATHKPYPIPKSDIYLPIHVGKKNSKIAIDDFIGDNTNDNISEKNPVFCELTALYWAWKNLDSDHIGLVHYRRYFKNPRNAEEDEVIISNSTTEDIADNPRIMRRLQKTLSQTSIERISKTSDVILPKKRNYYIENLHDHYCKTMNPEPLMKVREIIKKKCPEYLPEFNRLKTRRSAHIYNMLIMRRNILDQYCSWLFPILFELEKEIDTTDWSDFQKRYAGRISERLLDVWLNTNHIQYAELPVISIESVNWLKKGAGFLKAKFLRKQYEKSW